MEKKNFKLLLIAGHGNGDVGATGNGYKEFELTRELVSLIKKESDLVGINCDIADTSKNYFSYLKYGGHYDFTPYTYVGEIHFNSSVAKDTVGDGKMKGSMFYISQSETGHSVEDAILRNVYAVGSRKAWDGVVVSQRQYSGGLLVQEYVRKQGVSHGLFETCFISDKDDMNWYQKNKAKIAQAYIKGLIEGFGLTEAYEGNMFYVGKGIGTGIALESMIIRNGAGIDYNAYTTITKGTAVEVLEITSNGWFKIVWAGADCGYAYTSYQSGKYYNYIPNHKEYIVKSGDTLSSIARKQLGSESRYKEIMKLNELKSTVINIGQVLLIPTK